MARCLLCPAEAFGAMGAYAGDLWVVARAVVARELTPWALGLLDPVRERVAGRARTEPAPP